MSELHRFDSPRELVEHLQQDICRQLKAAIEERGEARLVVSGGNTPLPLFRALSQSDLDWSRVGITLADERLVASDHPRSNERLVREALMQQRAQAAQFIPLQDVANAWQGNPRFDLVILGLGGDGHTASLFPDAPELAEALRMDGDILQTTTPPSQPETRLTLTLGALCEARKLLLHIEGEEKLAVLMQAQQSGPVEELPVRSVLRQEQAPLEIYWAP